MVTDPSMGMDLAMVSDPAIKMDLAMVSDPAIKMDPAMVSHLAIKMDPAMVSHLAIKMDPAMVSDLAIKMDPAMVSDPAMGMVTDPCMMLDPTVATDPAVYMDMATDPVMPIDPAVATSSEPVAPVRRKRRALSIREKLCVIELKEGKSLRELARIFGIGRTQVLHIIQRSEEIKAAATSLTNLDRKRLTDYGLNSEINERMKEWCHDKISRGISLTGPQIQKQALLVAAELGNTEFKASSGWLDRFKNRNGMTQRNSSRDYVPVDQYQ